MDEHPAPAPPPPIVVLRTTTDILKKTTSIFSTRNNLLMFLLLSFILFSQRLIIDLSTHSLTSYIDNEPSIKSTFYRIPGPPNSTSPTTAITTTRRHHRHPSLQDNELDLLLFGSSIPKPQSNATSFILDSFDSQFLYSNFVFGNGIRASETLRSSAKIIEKEENAVINETNDSAPFTEEHHDFTASLFPIGVFIASYGFLMSGLVLTHSIVHGIIFELILNNFCRRYNSFAMTFFSGCSLGYIRSSNFIFQKSVIRDVFTLLISAWYFGGIEDEYSLLKIYARSIFMPYSIFVPWVKGFEKEIQGFFLAWLVADIIVSFVLTVDPWIVMADSRKNLRDVLKEGCHLLSLVFYPAFKLKNFEGLVCGPYARYLLAQTFGSLFAVAFQSFMEVYFMVAWLMYYLSVKSIHANSRGQPFGQREVEAMLKDVPI